MNSKEPSYTMETEATSTARMQPTPTVGETIQPKEQQAIDVPGLTTFLNAFAGVLHEEDPKAAAEIFGNGIDETLLQEYATRFSELKGGQRITAVIIADSAIQILAQLENNPNMGPEEIKKQLQQAVAIAELVQIILNIQTSNKVESGEQPQTA